MKQKFDLVTSDFTYVRWLGDRKGIEKQTTTWDKTVIDRTSDLKNWVELLRRKRHPTTVWTKYECVAMMPFVDTSGSVHEGIDGHFRANQ